MRALSLSLSCSLSLCLYLSLPVFLTLGLGCCWCFITPNMPFLSWKLLHGGGRKVVWVGEGAKSFRVSIANLHFQAWQLLVVVVQLKLGGLGLEVTLPETGALHPHQGSRGLHRHMGRLYFGMLQRRSWASWALELWVFQSFWPWALQTWLFRRRPSRRKGFGLAPRNPYLLLNPKIHVDDDLDLASHMVSLSLMPVLPPSKPLQNTLPTDWERDSRAS